MKIFTTLMAVFSLFSLTAQEHGTLKGKVTTVYSGESIPYANITLSKALSEEQKTTADYEGNYRFSKLDTGIYQMEIHYIGYQSKKLTNIRVSSMKATMLNVALSPGISLSEVEIIGYTKPLIETDKTSVGQTVTRQEIAQMAVLSVSDVTKTAGNGVYSRDNGSSANNLRGSRQGRSVTFIDGVKIVGSTSLPKSAIEEVNFQTGGVSAQYENDVADPSVSFNIIGVQETSSLRSSKNRVKKNELHVEELEEVEIFENELYQEIADNPFESPLKTPLSTFSIDVDKASYANVRRFLNQGYLPPINAVRIEEMINYFDYDYPQPKDEHPFSISTELSACPWNPERQLAMIGIQGKEVDMKDAPNSNLVFLIDVSGSMGSYNKLDLLKKGLNLLIDELRSNDRLAIVVYAGAAGVVLNSTAGNKKQEIKRVLNQLSSGGSTAGGAGIQLAYKIAKENFIEGGNNRIILATDGDFNVGASSQESLVKMIERKRESGVFLSVLGFGDGNLQDYKMEQLANKGNGNYNYIDNILEAKKVLVKEMGGTLLTIAKDVKVQAEFNPEKVRAYRLIGYVNRALADEDFNDDRKDAGELGSGHSVTVLYELIPTTSSEKIMDVDSLKYQKVQVIKNDLSDEVLTVKFRYKAPDGDSSTLMTKVLKDEPVVLEDASANLKFSASVASFGMKLRRSESVSNYEFKSIRTLAKISKGRDQNGYRAEFLKLVEMAELLDQGRR